MSYPPLHTGGWRRRALRVLEAERDQMVEKMRDEDTPEMRRAATENANAIHYAMDVIERDVEPPPPRPFAYERPEVTIPTAVAFEVMDTMRLAAMYLAPPEDWKPEKFESPLVYAGRVADAYRAFMHAMAKDWDIEDEVFPDA